MNSNMITVPPRPVRPAASRPDSSVSPSEEDLRQLALDIARHDPVLAHLLARAGERARQGKR